ncbi:unnamed protein product [Phyllotreta striolata]|uniref:CRAL-TRIO domain-containing protein n=1 Tax=Phyllotreta striolata TaxID=444603 RepID=A0A9N9TNE6_PHYSR|nr:unnamed protein product [Phyllotreta striolata]
MFINVCLKIARNMVSSKGAFCRRLHEHSTQILLVFVFVLVTFTFLSNTFGKVVVVEKTVVVQRYSGNMNEPAELVLPYKFTAEELIQEGRISRKDVEEVGTFVSNLNDKYVPAKLQDETICIFLLSCEHDVELTKKTIISYYLLKYQGPEIYDNRELNNTDIKLALNTIHMSSIPVRTENNDVYHYFNIHDSYYRNFDLVPIMKISYMLMDVSQEKNPPNGIIVVIDFKGFGLMHMSKIKMQAIKKYLTFLQEGFPMKLKTIHIINSVYFIDKILALVKVFIKNELMSMLHFHTPDLSQEKLFEIIPKKYLPSEYGGDLPSESELHRVTLEQFEKLETFWKIEEKIRKKALSE